jgi:bifunctional non-homologous end joining protein LigD
MMASVAKSLPTGADWSYEVKWDGYRAEAVKNGAAVSLASRNLKNITQQYPAVARAVSGVGAKAAVIDGEIVALDADGRPSFQALHHASTAGLSVVYYAFDLLHLNGRDLFRVPLDDRRAALRDIVGGSGVLLSDPLPGSAQQIEAAVRRLQLEGVVAKRRRSIYEPGRRSNAWIKVRFARHQELVIGGWTEPRQSRTHFGALLLGGLIETGCPVRILQGVQDPDVPWQHAVELSSRLARDDVVLTLVKDGDHRLSRPEDIERLIAAVAEF